ncbi:FeoA domain-containing protein [Clostridium sp. Ade.TY]|uniref:FeoA family protein n=1 Tax=Clostridium sp. Ade.TY TaxID=1391647 RepID=UPI00040A6390|nr:FeoA domain-containing protein [Clostridium sp. Ade.TY]
MIPITFMEEGKRVKIKDIKIDDKFSKRINEMGISKGSLVEIIKNDGDYMILGVSGSRFAISKMMAQKILSE